MVPTRQVHRATKESVRLLSFSPRLIDAVFQTRRLTLPHRHRGQAVHPSRKSDRATAVFPSSGAWALQPKIKFCLWQFFCGTKSHHTQPLDRSGLKSRSRPTPRVSRNYGYFCGADSVARRLVAVSTAVVRCGARYRMLCFTRDVVLRRGFTCAAGSSRTHSTYRVVGTSPNGAACLEKLGAACVVLCGGF